MLCNVQFYWTCFTINLENFYGFYIFGTFHEYVTLLQIYMLRSLVRTIERTRSEVYFARYIGRIAVVEGLVALLGTGKSAKRFHCIELEISWKQCSQSLAT